MLIADLMSMLTKFYSNYDFSLEFVREGMSPKEAMLMLIINGLIDKFAKQKALQTVEILFKNETCIPELCKMATKFVSFHTKLKIIY